MKNIFNTVRSMVPDSENIRISNNDYVDSYFRSGFFAPGVFVGFDFLNDDDRKNYDFFLAAIRKRKNLYASVIKKNWNVAGVAVWFNSDYQMISFIEDEKRRAVDSYCKNDHEMRLKGFSDTARNTILKGIHFENVGSFLLKYKKIA